MAYHKTKYRRRREGKTDYKARLGLLKSGLPRIVARKTGRYITMQVATSKEAQDAVLLAANSKELLGYGWPPKLAGSLKSLPAAYLTGFLLGNKIKKAKNEIKKAILDIGLQRSTKGARIYAAVKGLIDSGFDISCSKEMFPSEQRLYGRHMKEKISLESIKGEIQKAPFLKGAAKTKEIFSQK